MFVWFKSRLNPWYISIPSNPNLYSTKIIMKMRWQTIASSVSMRTISPTATPLPTAYDCVAVYIAGRRTNLVVYGCRPKPTTKNPRKWIIMPTILHMMTSYNRKMFALLALCAGNSPVTGEFSSQKPVTRIFDIFFDLRVDGRLDKRWRRRRFKTSSRSLWRHCNVYKNKSLVYMRRKLPYDRKI